jgi:hypothetical protein
MCINKKGIKKMQNFYLKNSNNANFKAETALNVIVLELDRINKKLNSMYDVDEIDLEYEKRYVLTFKNFSISIIAYPKTNTNSVEYKEIDEESGMETGKFFEKKFDSVMDMVKFVVNTIMKKVSV